MDRMVPPGDCAEPPRPARVPVSSPSSSSSHLLDRIRLALRTRHYSRRTEKAYTAWVHRVVLFHGKRHPTELGAPEVGHYLSHLASVGKVSASTQNQAFSALLFLYRDVLGRELAGLADTPRAKRPERLPLVLAPEEVRAVLRRMHGIPCLMSSLMYGGGLRLLECCRLRVKDVDFARHEITVHDGKGRKDRITVLPARLVPRLQDHLDRVQRQFLGDIEGEAGYVELPDALARKYPSAPREWAWQWVFPARRIHVDVETGQRRRHHLHETVLQRAF